MPGAPLGNPLGLHREYWYGRVWNLRAVYTSHLYDSRLVDMILLNWGDHLLMG